MKPPVTPRVVIVLEEIFIFLTLKHLDKRSVQRIPGVTVMAVPLGVIKHVLQSDDLLRRLQDDSTRRVAIGVAQHELTRSDETITVF